MKKKINIVNFCVSSPLKDSVVKKYLCFTILNASIHCQNTSQTFFQHRYGAHGAFTMSKGWERFFFIFTWLTEGSSYLSPRTYAIMHRMHHAYADTDKDPHSPLHYKNVFAMMWATKTIYTNIFDNNIPIE